MDKKSPIIFYDGICGLCNHFISFVFKYDHKKQFYFSPLQGQTATKSLPEKYLQDLKTIVLIKNNITYTQSSAVLEVICDFGGFWTLLKPLKLIPKFIRDTAYNIIASNRYKIFGKKETCRLPTIDERTRLLD